MSKILAVFGATGIQGGSVVRAILNDNALSSEFKIRAITRDASKPAAQEFAAKGVEIVTADMSSVELVASAVEKAHTVFLVTNFWENFSEEVEISQGKAVTDACKAAGVQHLIFSSLINTTKASDGRLPNITHFVGKSKIEQYIRDSGVPATFVLAGLYMSNLFSMIRKGDNGHYSMAVPVSEKAQFPLFDAAGDTGKFVAATMRNYPTCLGKQIYACTKYYTPSEIVSEFSSVLNMPATYVHVPSKVAKSFFPDVMAQEMLETLLLLDDPGYYEKADLAESLKLLNEEPTTWKEFVHENEANWL